MPVIGKLAVTSAWLNFQCSLVSPHSSPRRGEWHGLRYLTVADIQVHHQELSMVVAPCGNDDDDDDGDNDDDDFHVNDNDDGRDKNNLLFFILELMSQPDGEHFWHQWIIRLIISILNKLAISFRLPLVLPL